jgi:hypothetical protein
MLVTLQSVEDFSVNLVGTTEEREDALSEAVADMVAKIVSVRNQIHDERLWAGTRLCLLTSIRVNEGGELIVFAAALGAALGNPDV